ncbi:hypothetical protein HI914_04238 [Erysiphe necator]|nr:hypothetical protein HI914_04238 [Erysiphe necator]
MGEKTSSRNHQSRKERKAKKRAVENSIPDIPTPELELEPEPVSLATKSAEEVKQLQLDNSLNANEPQGNKRKRNKDGNGESGDNDEEEIDKKKKSKKRNKNLSNKEAKFCEVLKNSVSEATRENINYKNNGEEQRYSPLVKDEGKKKEKKKDSKTKKSNSIIATNNTEEGSSPLLDQEKSSSQKSSKKERKTAKLNVVALKHDHLQNGKNSDDHSGNENVSEIVGNQKKKKIESKVQKMDISKEGLKDSTSTIVTTTTITPPTTTTTSVDEKISKKKKHKKKNSQDPDQSIPKSTSTIIQNTNLPSKRSIKKTSENLVEKVSSSPPRGKSRFIVFVGNLPYTATKDSIMSHFSKLKPLSVRHLTKKEDSSKSRGIAFVEFENFDTHKTALKIMHHSIFDDGKSEPRMINVELTAGGGGNTEDRKTKIKVKNEKLNEERIRRVEEDKAKLKKEEEKKSGLGKESSLKDDQNSSESHIHPSRRRMITA